MLLKILEVKEQLTNAADIAELSLFYVPDEVESIKYEAVKIGYNWIKSFMNGAGGEFMRNYNRISRERWDAYRQLGGMKTSAEWRLLAKSAVKIRYEIRNRPQFFRKTFRKEITNGSRRKNGKD